MNEIEELFKKFEELITQYPYKENTETVLSVIGRQFDEDLISRIVAYIIEKDQGLQFRLLEYGNNYNYDINNELTLDYVEPEFKMNDGRADIFAVFNKGTILLTIENKIKTWEHNTGSLMQTEVYQNYVENLDKNAKKVFLYLKPDWNDSEPKSKRFKSITYSKMLEMISCDVIEKYPIIKDFSEHIKSYLGEEKMEFSELDKNINCNIYKYRGAISSFEKKINKVKEDLIERIKNELSNFYKRNINDDNLWSNGNNDDENDLFFQTEKVNEGIGIGSFRIYKRSWYCENEYYFFAEIKFEKGMFDNIFFQSTLKDYKNKKTCNYEKTKRFKKMLGLNTDQFSVYKKEKYKSVNSFFGENEKWCEDFVNKAAKKLIEYLDETEHLYKEYCNFQ